MNISPWRLAARTERMNPSVIREILKLTELPGIISLAGGLPSPDTFPVEAMRLATARVLRDNPREALQYAASEGYPPLREWVAAEMRGHGVAVDASQVLITTGSQQGLDLVGKALIESGSTVAVESPTYLGALQAFTPYEPEFAAIDCDDEGPLPDALVERGRGARFLYVLPNFQNPSGRSIGAARRAAIVASAQRIGLPIVEDNPYGELWFDAEPAAPIASLWREGTIYLGSFSKVLAPGLRLGYAIAPAEVMPKLLQAKQAADLHTPSFKPAPGARGDQGRLPARARADDPLPLQGAARRDAGGARGAPAAERTARLPLARAGRRHVLLGGAAGGRRRRGAAAARVERGVAFVPGAPFYAGAAMKNTLRLSFVTVAPEAIARGVRALAAALETTR
jgi:2-aminoadipate transaminase